MKQLIITLILLVKNFHVIVVNTNRRKALPKRWCGVCYFTGSTLAFILLISHSQTWQETNQLSTSETIIGIVLLIIMSYGKLCISKYAYGQSKQ